MSHLGYWPDVGIVVLGLVAIFLFRRAAPRRVLGIAFGAAALLMVWIAVRSYAAGDTFGTWLFIALAVVMIAVTPRLSDALLALRRRPPPP